MQKNVLISAACVTQGNIYQALFIAPDPTQLKWVFDKNWPDSRKSTSSEHFRNIRNWFELDLAVCTWLYNLISSVCLRIMRIESVPMHYGETLFSEEPSNSAEYCVLEYKITQLRYIDHG